MTLETEMYVPYFYYSNEPVSSLISFGLYSTNQLSPIPFLNVKEKIIDVRIFLENRVNKFKQYISTPPN